MAQRATVGSLPDLAGRGRGSGRHEAPTIVLMSISVDNHYDFR
jgi:hypothetical protein